jgi:hypothetical protein
MRREQPQHVLIDPGADGFHKVAGQRIAVPLICMEHTDTRIQPHRQCRDARFRLEDGIEIVEQGIRWIDGTAR